MSHHFITVPIITRSRFKTATASLAEDSRLRWRQLDWPLTLIVGLSLFINLMGITWGLPAIDQGWWDEHSNPSNFAWEHDSVAPVSPLAAARELFAWGPWSRENYVYPLFHYILLSLLYAPFIGYWLMPGLVTIVTFPTDHSTANISS